MAPDNNQFRGKAGYSARDENVNGSGMEVAPLGRGNGLCNYSFVATAVYFYPSPGPVHERVFPGRGGYR